MRRQVRAEEKLLQTEHIQDTKRRGDKKSVSSAGRVKGVKDREMEIQRGIRIEKEIDRERD